jgi:hypothetical protein
MKWVVAWVRLRILCVGREEVTWGWKRLHNEELHNLYPSSNIIRVIETRRMGLKRHVERMGGVRNSYNILVGKPEGRNHSERPRCRWENNIIMDHREIGWGGVNWMRLTQDRDQLRALVNMVTKLRVPYKTRNFLTIWVTISFWRTLLHAAR